MDFHLSHIVRVGIAVKHFVDVGEVSVGHGIVIAERIVSQNQEIFCLQKQEEI